MKIRKFLAHSPIFSLYRAQADLVEDFQARLGRHDIHLLQGLILTALFFEERPVRPSELAEAFSSERSTISHAIRGLERSGLLRRDLHPADARGYLLALTTAGRRRALTLIREFDLVQDGIEAELGARRLRAIVAGLERLRAAYGKWREKT